jgi:ABC-type nitrate/sulfonate/bicarbonate transport system substrate-binding protein
LVVAIVLSSFVYLNSQKPYTGNVESIAIGMVPNENSALIYVAQNQQYFIDNGLNVTLKNYISVGTAIGGLLNGGVNVSLSSDYVLVTSILTNASVSTFGTISKGESVYLVGRTDRGINNISDLKGKTIGVALGTAGEFYLGTFLQSNGIELNQVTEVNVPLGQSTSALANGTVDAVESVQPYISTIQNQLGNRAISWSVQSNQPYYVDAVCLRSWAAAHPDLIVRFLKAMIQAQNYISNNQNNAMSIVENKLNYTNSYIATVWPYFQFSVSLDQSQIVAMQNEAQWAISNNLTSATQVPTFINYVYTDGLSTVNPDAVNIIK